MGVLPPYRIEPPDIVSIDVVNLVPKSPYYLNTGDVIQIDAQGTLPEQPVSGAFPIQVGGLVALGFDYGAVKVVGMTVQEAQQAIADRLRLRVTEPRVFVSLLSTVGEQQLSGEHLVGPDGTLTLGSYGGIMVVGMTVAEAKSALERHLAQFLENPRVSLSVFAYNSKVYYVVVQGAGSGDQLFRFPSTGNENVIDALAQIQGLTPNSSTRIWIARPGGATENADCILPVDWYSITQHGRPDTNYQILPGDRVYVAEDEWVAAFAAISKITAPFERIFGFSLLGADAVSRFSGNVLQGGGLRGAGFGGFGF
jgi:protein involved in polysaccharide export with SLBB domain